MGDYALGLARLLARDHSVQTIFAIPKVEAKCVEEFEVRTIDPKTNASLTSKGADWILLHYVNYGYQARGLPTWMPGFLKRLGAPAQPPLFTIFHELYATSSPRHSAFWLQPWQKRIARDVARLSKHCVVSSGTVAEQLRALVSEAKIFIQPVPSNFGEPALSPAQLAGRDPQRWAICGGTAMVLHNLRSLARHRPFLPAEVQPNELFVIGGTETAETHAAIRSLNDLKISYHPAVTIETASELLATCAFGWLDYLDRRTVPLEVILKSSSFSAFAAHGVIPVFPWGGSPLCLDGNCVPGPFFANRQQSKLPAPNERDSAACGIYEFYQRHAAMRNIARRTAHLLQPGAPSALD